MDWLGDVSNFVVGATIHWIAVVSAKILHHPDMQEALAQSVALGVQKLLKDGPPVIVPSDSNSNKDSNQKNEHHQLLRVLGKWLLALGGGGANNSKSTPKKHKKRTNGEADSATQCTTTLEEEGHHHHTAPTKVVHIATRSATSTPFSTPTRGTTVSTREYETAPEDEYQEYLC
jgi:hypothetical protein